MRITNMFIQYTYKQKDAVAAISARCMLLSNSEVSTNSQPLHQPARFLPRDAVHPRYQPRPCVRLSVCPSVCLSVTSQCSTKTAKRRITQTTPHDSAGTLFLLPKISAKFDRGHPLRGHRMQVGWVKIGYISKTVQDRHIVSIKVEQEVVRALSNGDIAVDLECPLTTQNHPIFCILHRYSQLRNGQPRDFKFGTLAYHSTSHRAEEKSSLKGARSGSNNPFQNFTPHVISPQRRTLETSDFVHRSAM